MKHPSPTVWQTSLIGILFIAFFLQSNAFASVLVQTTKDSHFYCLDTLNPQKKLIILIHGWSAIKSFDTPLQETKDYYEKDWQNFIKYFKSENVCLHTWDVRKGLPHLDNPLTDVLTKLHDQHQISYNMINIIAHSQGGNYSKDALLKLYLQQQTEELRNINLITMATPHTGSERLYMRNVVKSAEILGYVTAGILYGAKIYSLYQEYKNANTEEEKNDKQNMLGIWGTLGFIGAILIGHRVSKFDEIYNYPGLLQLLPLPENPLLTQINKKIIKSRLSQSISAIYSDYGIGTGDEVVPKNSGSWKGVKLKARKLFTGRSHLDFIKGDKDMFASVNNFIK